MSKKRKAELKPELEVNDRETWIPEIYDYLMIRNDLDNLNKLVKEKRRKMNQIMKHLIDNQFFKKRMDRPIMYEPKNEMEKQQMGGPKKMRYTEQTKFESFSNANVCRLLSEVFQEFFNGSMSEEACNTFGTQLTMNAWGMRKSSTDVRIRCDPLKEKSSRVSVPRKKPKKMNMAQMRETEIGKELISIMGTSSQE